jgi:hypothetical protein
MYDNALYLKNSSICFNFCYKINFGKFGNGFYQNFKWKSGLENYLSFLPTTRTFKSLSQRLILHFLLKKNFSSLQIPLPPSELITSKNNLQKKEIMYAISFCNS